jgi:enamine deaminase RidA (YjgF/YER057c/UK114 family)
MAEAKKELRIYNVDALGEPLGQYSHVARVRAGELLFIAGMLAPGADVQAQCAGVFAQIGEALKSAGAGWGNVVQFTTYLVHSQDIPGFMQFRLREFPRLFPNGAYPPNTLLVIERLVQEQFLVEVQTVAAL